MRVLNPVAKAVYADIQFGVMDAPAGEGATFHAINSALNSIPLPGALKGIKSPILKALGTLTKADVSLTTASNAMRVLDATKEALIHDKDFGYEIEKQFGTKDEALKNLIAEFSTNWIFGLGTIHANNKIDRLQRIENMKSLSKLLEVLGYPTEAKYVDNLRAQFESGDVKGRDFRDKYDDAIEGTKDILRHESDKTKPKDKPESAPDKIISGSEKGKGENDKPLTRKERRRYERQEEYERKWLQDMSDDPLPEIKKQREENLELLNTDPVAYWEKILENLNNMKNLAKMIRNLK